MAIGLDQSPGTARWRLLLMSEKEEIAWSQKRFEDLLEAEAPLILPEADERVQVLKRVCDRLVAAMEAEGFVCAAIWPRDNAEVVERIRRFEARTSIRPSARTQNSLLPFRPESSNPTKIIDNRDWDLFVVDMPRVNAFVLPTKEIFVYSGLLDLLEKEEPLIAAVIAHEIIHVSERHAVENMGFLALSSVIFDILRGITFAVTISFPFVTDTLGTLFNMMNGVVAERAYSRKLESEADTLGLMLMAKAGYNPESALELWGLLNMLENDARDNHSILLERVLPFLRTHPQGEARLDNIRDHLPEAMRIYGESQKPTKAQQIVASLVNVPDKDEITEIANVQKDPHLFP
ncbi:MAG: hypothetical protein CYPHOPRED_002307 [Cyphobasidiales sp. Tagirdzhanova-0007]|nr:MAG: hypothetical protein CYPHOPRED_002307 [Cyphobasidiales sp. Tagirdzhanova-0007]